MAILLAVSVLLHNGHTQPAGAVGIPLAIENTHADAAAEQGPIGSCGDEDKAGDDADCCVSAGGCTICVLIPAEGIVSSKGRGLLAFAPDPVSLPGDTALRLRPPKVFVIA
ncbi:hypothetical protein [Sinorhizobium meliloti]|uniref:hypothetical protein n=1 Tax=Rhizobium meliloti TaxID=382 RepID=UPI0012958966|nr:hypothetical protein [Sinorhizobium meliloti]MDW9688389.1 hypothetical protein [Sinorhizobium meliloti]MQU97072.1 hypothetical protein [Sinorhizobium meliloti]MQV12985.1 hypothetical protein [Sinorhizobium meliloti]